MSWCRIQEDILKRWSGMAKTYSNIHELAADHCRQWDNRLGIPVVLLGTVTASSVLTTDHTADPNSIWRYVNAGLVLAMTGISGVARYMKLSEMATKHTATAFRYTEIAMNIDTILSFSRADRREDARTVVNSTKMALLDIKEGSATPPSWIVTSFIKRMDKHITGTGTAVNRHRGNTPLSTPVNNTLPVLSPEEIVVGISTTEVAPRQVTLHSGKKKPRGVNTSRPDSGVFPGSHISQDSHRIMTALVDASDSESDVDK